MKSEILIVCTLFVFSCGGGNQNDEETEQPGTGMQVITSIDTSRKNLIQENLFEEEDYLHGFKKDQSCCDYSVQKTEGALRFELRKSDPVISGSKRAEVTGKSYRNEDSWYGFRVRLEDWTIDDAGEHIIQWHPQNKTGSANVSLWTSSGIYMLVVSPDGSNNNYFEIDSIKSGVAADFVLHIKWNDLNRGLVELWKDGKYISKTLNNKTLPYKGTTSETGAYLKLGINKFGWADEPSSSQSTTAKRVLYFEEFREGNELASYKDVKPGK